MRRRNFLIGTLALAVVVTTVSGVAYSFYVRAQPFPGLYAPVSAACPGPPDPITGQGGAAIRPRNDCTPSFTQQDVRDYLAHVVRLGSISVTRRPTVTRIMFLTISDLDRLGRNVVGGGYPADMLLCYAGLSGMFTLYGLLYSPPQTISAVSIVFDAHTGNTLVIVAGPLLG